MAEARAGLDNLEVEGAKAGEAPAGTVSGGIESDITPAVEASDSAPQKPESQDSTETEATEDEVASEIAPASVRRTIPGAIARRQLLRDSEVAKPKQGLSCLFIATTSLAWMTAFAWLQVETKALPWSALFSGVASLSLSWLFASRRVNPLSLFRYGENRKTTFTDSFAGTFSGLSALMAAWMCFHYLHPAPPDIVKRQVVDIELVSPSDYQDRKDPLPGTEERAVERKRIANAEKSAAVNEVSLKSAAVVPSKARPRPLKVKASNRTTEAKLQHETVKPKPQSKPDVEESPKVALLQPAVNLGQMPVAWKTVTVPVAVGKPVLRQSSPTRNASLSAPVLEEVSPPEMVEMTDNDGDTKGQDLFQPGGHSTGGKGAPTALLPYLKEIHKRIKIAWKPPAHDARSAQILFRIKKDGKLASVKLVRSSGSSDNDGSAMSAITASAPFKALPKTYAPAYLDLLYTFNLNVDELTEVPGSEVQ